MERSRRICQTKKSQHHLKLWRRTRHDIWVFSFAGAGCYTFQQEREHKRTAKSTCGSGTIWQLRVTDCEGPLCYMMAGTSYPIHWDMTPNIPIPSLRLKVRAIYMGHQVTIIDAVLDNSSVQPGTTYTIQYTLTPYEVVCENTMRVSAELSNTASGVVEVCVAFQVHVTCDEEEEEAGMQFVIK
ncbi:hypothetical protein Fcan01_27715 [Folsomia candida]|uniref:MD-2-related lipid-recognition domain-containing protein n=1 Tax=Folsomia candida TaxID=158441 RepID=A0A226CXK8_FOLCA|nr:hypothetical protein Fcan01_27715 [Folsomia candida]